MFIIWKVPKSIAGRTEGPRGPHAARVFETPDLDDLFLELTNIKAGCYMVEILLNDFIFADDVCVFWPSVRGLQSGVAES